jgi:hypothetical protein
MKYNCVMFSPHSVTTRQFVCMHITMPVVTKWYGFCRTYDDFTQKYYRLDMCHINLDNLSVLQGRNIAQTPWKSQQFLLQFINGRGECVSTWRTWRSFSTVVLALTLSAAIICQHKLIHLQTEMDIVCHLAVVNGFKSISVLNTHFDLIMVMMYWYVTSYNMICIQLC